MQGDLNAIGLIVVLVFTAVILFQFGELKPKRIVLSLLAGLLTVIVMAIQFTYKCGPGNNPSYQIYIPALCLILIIMFVKGQNVLWISSLILFVAGYLLSWHFHFLIFKAGSYTGEPRHLSCPQSKDDRKETVMKQWHTSLTGLYKLSL
jgi:hypothetical protein